MDDSAGRLRLYSDLARWWPLISPPEEYEEEASFATSVLKTASIPVRGVLELGSGGGHNAFHMKATFDLTLVDLSEAMLGVSRQLNPECEHLQGDMRTVRLGRTFDAVFAHDAIDYMMSEADLRAAMTTAFEHCRPGGIAVFVPDFAAETFEDYTDHCGVDGADGRGARLFEWSWDPDPNDTWTQTDYVFMLRESDGTLDVVQETHRTGLFGREVWLRLLTEVGFESAAITESTSEDRMSRELFVGHRPLTSA